MYIIELYLNGLKDAGTCTPAADSIVLLRHRRQALLSPEWTEQAAFEIQHAGYAYDLIGGVFAHINEDVDDQVEFIWLPNSRNKKGHTVRRDLNETMPISCLTIDPTQDLIVFLENNVDR
jgi:hypothetical protein